MARSAAFRVNDAIEMTLELARSPDGYVFFNGKEIPYIWIETFRRYVVTHYGSDKSTIRKYKQVLEDFSLMRDNMDIGRLEFTYENSPTYQQYLKGRQLGLIDKKQKTLTDV